MSEEDGMDDWVVVMVEQVEVEVDEGGVDEDVKVVELDEFFDDVFIIQEEKKKLDMILDIFVIIFMEVGCSQISI